MATTRASKTIRSMTDQRACRSPLPSTKSSSPHPYTAFGQAKQTVSILATVPAGRTSFFLARKEPLDPWPASTKPRLPQGIRGFVDVDSVDANNAPVPAPDLHRGRVSRVNSVNVYETRLSLGILGSVDTDYVDSKKPELSSTICVVAVSTLSTSTKPKMSWESEGFVDAGTVDSPGLNCRKGDDLCRCLARVCSGRYESTRTAHCVSHDWGRHVFCIRNVGWPVVGRSC